MLKSDALHFVFWASAFICFCGCALDNKDSRYSMTQATVQQARADHKIMLTSAFQLLSQDQKSYPCSNEWAPDRSQMAYTAVTDFSQRLQGGILVSFEFGLIVVKSTAPQKSLQPTALTTDAIITASVRSKIAGRSQLPPRDFEIQTDDGVVTIRAKGESLDQAAEVINLALGVPDVRRIVYTMPSSA
jgi:BON domain